MGHGSMHGAWQGQCSAWQGRAGQSLGLQGKKGLRRQSERATRRADCKDVSSARAAMVAQRAATAFAPSGPMPLLLRPNSWTLLTVLPRSASHSMMVPSSRKSFPPTKMLVTDAMTKISAASSLASPGPRLRFQRLSSVSSCVSPQSVRRLGFSAFTLSSKSALSTSSWLERTFTDVTDAVTLRASARTVMPSAV